MSLQALTRLATEARTFARAYVALTEALMSQGVTEEQARFEARMTALMCSLEWDDADDEPGEWRGLTD